MSTGMIEATLAPSEHAWHFHDREAGDHAFVALATSLDSVFAPLAVEHDCENTFVYETFDLLRDAGYLRLVVPRELGGLGASMRHICFAQGELARHCASTALAVTMHLYLTLSNVFRWRRGASGAEAGSTPPCESRGFTLLLQWRPSTPGTPLPRETKQRRLSTSTGRERDGLWSKTPRSSGKLA